MGWIWVNDSPASASNYDSTNKPLEDSAADGKYCSTSTVVRSQCKTEEVEPGKFIRKCDKTEEILRHCFGKPSEVIQSTTEHTEEDITNQIPEKPTLPNQFQEHPLDFGFPGLRNDVDIIERHFITGMKKFLEAAEELQNSFIDIMGDHHHSNTTKGTPIEDRPKVEEHRNKENTPRQSPGGIYHSGLAKDV